MEKIKPIIPHFAAFVSLCVVGAISLHFIGIEYGLGIGYLLGRYAGVPLQDLIKEKVLKK